MFRCFAAPLPDFLKLFGMFQPSGCWCWSSSRTSKRFRPKVTASLTPLCQVCQCNAPRKRVRNETTRASTIRSLDGEGTMSGNRSRDF
eukprot:3634410-Amphidinium_carterae.1